MIVVCSDIHLSHTPPVARAGEPDWYAAMGRQLDKMLDFCRAGGFPLFIAGDIFDRWTVPPELLNWTIKTIRRHGVVVYAIPGQHDLPNHSMGQIERSAYWTLMEAGVVKHLRNSVCIDGLTIHPFPWGSEIKFPKEAEGTGHVALIHAYCWKTDCGYPGAPEEARAGNFAKQLRGFSLAVFGDNHKPFQIKAVRNRPALLNCGGFYRRKADEIDHQPCFYTVDDDCSVEAIPLDVSHDVISREHISDRLDLTQFSDALKNLDPDSLDYGEALRVGSLDQPSAVQSAVWEIYDAAKEP